MSRNRKNKGKGEQADRQSWLKLITPTESTNDSVIKVAYCLTEDSLKRIVAQKLVNPYLLFLVVKKTEIEGADEYNGPTARYTVVHKELVPLKQGLFYVQFQSAGQYTVYATIVGDKNGKYMHLYHQCVELDWWFDVDPYTGRLIKTPQDTVVTFGADSFNCEVTAEFFAKEPPKWVQKWVNLLYHKGPIDQCQFRKRFAFAFLAQPFVLVLWLILTMTLRIGLAAIATILGYRNINYRAIYQLREKYFCEVLEDVDSFSNSVFLTEPSSGVWIRYEARPWAIPFFPVFPLLFVLLSGIYVYTKEEGMKGYGYSLTWESCLWGLKVYLGILIGIALAVVAIGIILGILSLVSKSARALIKAIRSASKSQAKVAIQSVSETAQLSYLACEKRMRTAAVSLEALPAERRTIKLRFLELKSKVCRPYQTSR